MANLIGFLAVVSAGNFAGHPDKTGDQECTVEMCHGSLARARKQQPRRFHGAIFAEKFFWERAQKNGPNGPIWEFCPLVCPRWSHKKGPELFKCSELIKQSEMPHKVPNIMSGNRIPMICPVIGHHWFASEQTTMHLYIYLRSFIYIDKYSILWKYLFHLMRGEKTFIWSSFFFCWYVLWFQRGRMNYS